jgi:hypothetical protein
MQKSNVSFNVVTRSARRSHRWWNPGKHATSLRDDKRNAHRADRRNAKQALKCHDYERYESRCRPRLTKYDVS